MNISNKDAINIFKQLITCERCGVTDAQTCTEWCTKKTVWIEQEELIEAYEFAINAIKQASKIGRSVN